MRPYCKLSTSEEFCSLCTLWRCSLTLSTFCTSNKRVFCFNCNSLCFLFVPVSKTNVRLTQLLGKFQNKRSTFDLGPSPLLHSWPPLGHVDDQLDQGRAKNLWICHVEKRNDYFPSPSKFLVHPVLVYPGYGAVSVLHDIYPPGWRNNASQ